MLWLVEYYPSPAYWSDLLDLMQTQAGSDARANLEVFRLKNATNAIKQPDDFIEAAQIAIQVGFPGEAQSIMEKGYSSKVLGKSAKSEREQRLLNMAKSQASADKASLPASAGGSGEAMAATGEAYLTYGQTSKAVTALNGALAKGGLKNKDEVQLHLGQAYLASGNAGEARRAFAKVGGKYADLAKLWVLHSQR
jgi:tetratricopeptide (TPR) repeat protein